LLGRLYAGQRVQLVARRGEEQLAVDVELTDKLIPYEMPFLGILPLRDSVAQGGVAVRYVFSGSGAADADLRPGDQLRQLGGEPIADAQALRLAVANRSVGDNVTLQVRRGEENLDVTVRLTALPQSVPERLPTPMTEERTAEPVEALPAATEMEVRIPEEPNACFAYVPRPRRPGAHYGLLVHLLPPGAADREAVVRTWQALCDEHQLILLAPQSQDARRWTPTEVDFVRKAIDQVREQYPVDSTRVVVFGQRAAGTMAYLVAFRLTQVVRGVAVVDAPAPGGLRPPDTDPVQRLAFYVVIAPESALRDRIRANIETLQEIRHNVTLQQLSEGMSDLDESQRDQLIRWLDTLDRI
jgi:serine protease Do